MRKLDEEFAEYTSNGSYQPYINGLVNRRYVAATMGESIYLTNNKGERIKICESKERSPAIIETMNYHTYYMQNDQVIRVLKTKVTNAQRSQEKILYPSYIERINDPSIELFNRIRKKMFDDFNDELYKSGFKDSYYYLFNHVPNSWIYVKE